MLIIFSPGIIAQAAVPIDYTFPSHHYYEIFIISDFYEIFFVATIPIVYILWNLISLILYIYFYVFHIPGIDSILKNKIEEFNLSKREEEVVHHLLSGLSYKKIGEVLFISIDTVKTHIANIYRK